VEVEASNGNGKESRRRSLQAGYKGRKPIAAERRQDVLKLAAEGATRTTIASQLGIGEATVHRILATDRGQKP
jgi:DNA invertase Pin-like site-specific DNA recombinase